MTDAPTAAAPAPDAAPAAEPSRIDALEARMKAIEEEGLAAVNRRIRDVEEDVAALAERTKAFVTREEHAAALAARGIVARFLAWLRTPFGLIVLAVAAALAGAWAAGGAPFACAGL